VDESKAEGFTAFDGIEKVQRGRMAMADEKQGNGFVHDVFRGQESAAIAGQFRLEPDGGRMMFVAPVPERQEPGTVHEHVSVSHKGCGQWAWVDSSIPQDSPLRD
jgi:hypothetical protein